MVMGENELCMLYAILYIQYIMYLVQQDEYETARPTPVWRNMEHQWRPHWLAIHKNVIMCNGLQCDLIEIK